MINENTPWRHIGAMPYEKWRSGILGAGGLPEYAGRDVWLALGDDSALAYQQLREESSLASDFDKIPAEWWNAWNLQTAGVGNKYPNAVAAAKAWRDRIYDPNYKNGVYAKTNTIREYFTEYAPPWDGNDTESYIRESVEGINRLGLVEEDSPVVDYNYKNGVMPDFKNYEVADSKKYAGYIDPAQHDIKAFVIHSAYGSLVGTTGWFQGGNALTDYMVGNTLDGASLDGELRRFNNPVGSRYAHASGPVDRPIEDAAKFLELFGPSPSVINMYTTALERSCNNSGSPAVSEKEHAKRVQLIAFWANEYGRKQKAKTGKDVLTCDTFPIIPSENNRSFLIYHGEVNAGKRQTCPDQNVRATLDRIIADVRTLLARWQKSTDTIPPEPENPNPGGAYAPVKPIAKLEAYRGDEAKDVAPAIVMIDGRAFVFVNDRVEAIQDTKRRQTAEEDALEIGPMIAKGEQFAVLWLFQEADGTPWYLTPWWTRVPVADTKRVKDEA